MKSIFTSLILALSLNTLAHTTIELKKSSNVLVESERAVAEKMATEMNKRYEHVGGGTVFNSYKFTKVSPTKKANESDLEFAERLVKSILHRDYPITGDDGGYSFNQIKFNTDADFQKYLSRNMQWISDSEEAAPFLKDFSKATLKLSQDSSVIILDGEGSGNNTMAYIFAVVDVKNNELFYVIDSNFGSDD